MAQFLAHIIGIREVPTIREVNVRAAPTITAALVTRLPVGTRGLRVVEVREDSLAAKLTGKVYQWFRLALPNGGEGWVRDDLIEVEGDGTSFGYPVLLVPAVAFSIQRHAAAVGGGVNPPPAGDASAPTARVIGKSGVNLRAQPINGHVIARLNFLQEVTIRGAQPQGGTSNYTWVEVDSPAGRGFVRDDYLSIQGDASAFGLSRGDEYPAPMKNRWWVRGFNINQNPGEPEHLGWDFGAQTGEPILAGPNGGTVTQVSICRKCTPDRPSTLMHGLSLSDPSIFNDEGWGFGYGTYVIVRYDNHLLPASTRERLVRRGLGSAHLFVLYGHLHSASVSSGQTATGGQPIGTCGNTGNSQATHLHLEIRAGTTLTPQWWQIRNGLLDPGVLFLR